MAKWKLFTDKTEFEKMRAHRDRLATEAGHKIPETPDMLVRGKKCGPEVIPDSAMLADHWDDGVQNGEKNEFALGVPDWDLKYADHETNIGGSTHKYDLSNLYTDLPEEWDQKPAPKVDSSPIAIGGRIP